MRKSGFQEWAAARGLAFSRATAGYRINQSGVWVSEGVDVPRFHHTEDGVPLGLFIEQASTNGVPNNSMQGAVAGTPGTLPTNWSEAAMAGLSREVVGTGVINGIEYVDLHLYGTATAGQYALDLMPFTGFPAVAGNVLTASGWVAVLPGGTGTLNVSQFFWTVLGRQAGGGGAEALATANLAVDTTFSRKPRTVTLANALTANASHRLNIPVTNGQPIDLYFRIGWPQLEIYGFATSPVRTTAGSVTQNADVFQNTSHSGITALSGLISGRAAPGYSNDQTLWQLDSGATNRISLVRNSARELLFQVIDTNATQANLTLGTIADGADFKVSFKVAANDFAATLNGASPQTDGLGTVPAGLVNYRYGRSTATTASWMGTISRHAEWHNLSLTNAQLQALAA